MRDLDNLIKPLPAEECPNNPEPGGWHDWHHDGVIVHQTGKDLDYHCQLCGKGHRIPAATEEDMTPYQQASSALQALEKELLSGLKLVYHQGRFHFQTLTPEERLAYETSQQRCDALQEEIEALGYRLVVNRSSTATRDFYLVEADKVRPSDLVVPSPQQKDNNTGG